MQSSAKNNSVVEFNILTGSKTNTYTGHTAEVTCLLFSLDKTKLQTCSKDCKINIQNLVNAKLIKTFSVHEKELMSIILSDDGDTI